MIEAVYYAETEAKMNASRILSEKGAAVFTVAPNQTLEEAARTLADRKIGACVVVGPDEAPVGVF
ncbi:MAG: CBS domain-containing protein, partial [Oceanicaulis sp.]